MPCTVSSTRGRIACIATRVYTQFDADLGRALETAVEAGLVAASASRSERLRALALYADQRLNDDREREEKLAAYRELAEDEERLAAIRGSVLAAVDDGIL